MQAEHRIISEFKRVLLLLAVALAAFVIFAIPVKAEIASGTLGQCPWRLTDDGELIIGEAGASHTINNYQTSNYCAGHLGEVKSISFEGNVSANGNISELFMNMTNLTKVGGGLNTSTVTLMSGLFQGCSSLTDISGLQDWNVNNVTDSQNMFNGCSSLTNDNAMSGWTWGKNKDFSNMFYNCTALEDISGLRNWNPYIQGQSGVGMAGIFKNCAAITDFSPLSGWNMQDVWSMEEMFYGCSMDNVDFLSNWNTARLNTMLGMFMECRNLNDLTGFADLNTSRVASTKYMFYNCKALESLDGLDNWNMSANIDMNSMFYGCSALTDIGALSDWDTQSCQSLNSTFYSCSSMADISALSGWDTGNVNNMWAMMQYCQSITNLDALSGWDTGRVVQLGTAFANCNSLEDIDGLAGWNVQKVTSMQGTFNSDRNLSDLSALAGWKTYALENLRSTFGGTAIEDVNALAEWDTSKVTTLQDTFISCHNLKNLDGLADWNVSKVTVIDNTFRDCTALEDIDGLTDWNTSSVREFRAVFYGDTSLRVANGVKNWATSHATKLESMFYSCDKLEEADITNFDTSAATSMWGFFSLCPKLRKITLGEHWNFISGNYTDYPTPPNNATYTGKWIREDEAYGPFTPAQLKSQYTPAMAGVWVWEERPTKYTLHFVAPDGVSGSMPDQKITAAEDGTIDECALKRFNYHFVRWVDDNGQTYADKAVIPANTFAPDSAITLTAEFEKNENKASFAEGVAEFILHAGEKLILPNLPGGALYQVWEETPAGWQLIEERDAAGEIPASGTANARFTNEYVPGTATVQLVASKTLDGQAPEDGAFTFRLSKDGEMVEERTNNASGVVMFDTLIFRQPGTYTYTIAEIAGDDDKIRYDAHEETITINVTDDGAGTLTAQTVYDLDGARFENETKPGTLTVTKETDGGGDPEETFTFEIRLTDPLGRSLDSVNMVSSNSDESEG